MIASAITYAIYASDKKRAQRGGWRISEALLHLCEAIGGWPGALLAQHHLHHKSAKISYLLVFGSIVAVYQMVAIDALLDWRIYHLLRNWTSSG